MYIDEILNEFNMEMTRKVLATQKGLNKNSRVSTLGKWNKDSSIDWYLMNEITKSIYINRLILDEWNHKEYLYQSYCDMYKSRYVLCSKCYERIPEWFIRWLLDDSKDILMIF